MKNLYKFLCVIAIGAIIGFTVVGCGDSGGSGSGGPGGGNILPLLGSYIGGGDFNGEYHDEIIYTFSNSNYTLKIDGIDGSIYERGTYSFYEYSGMPGYPGYPGDVTSGSVQFFPIGNVDSYGGSIENIYFPDRVTLTVRGIVFFFEFNNGNNGSSSNVYVGVATFNDRVNIFNISDNISRAKTFIDNSKNDVDATALCYAVSKGVTMFDRSGLPVFDNTFLVTFTDGADNKSSSLYVAEGKQVVQAQVYDQAQTDLAAKSELKSYAIGFGYEATNNETNMRKLVQNGQYKAVSNSYELDSIFKNIAYSILASPKNVTLKTNTGLFTDTYPKYFKLTVSAYSDPNTLFESEEILGKLVYNMGTPGAIPTFTVTQAGTYTTFDENITGTVSSGKILLSFKNFRYTKDGTSYFVRINVQIGEDGINYRTDTEDSSAEEDLNKTGVVLVIDCSQSLGGAFYEVKEAAKNFIDTLVTRY